ncbi:hypothetical protein, partial [Nostoc sp. CHAB 5715]|uniref:hypothetical protein n=1 Tax=Nostoc sp. CHAB 5715 TaxID=2780400 RepID=UPI001E4DC9E6
ILVILRSPFLDAGLSLFVLRQISLSVLSRSFFQKSNMSPIFWLNCLPIQLNELERQYIQYYCPTLNQSKIPQKKLLPSFQMLTLSLKKLNERVLVFGVCPASEKLPLKTIVIGQYGSVKAKTLYQSQIF